MRFHIVANPNRPDAVETAARTAAWLTDQGHEVRAEPETSRRTGVAEAAAAEFAEADAVVAFGGDGTLIRAAHLVSTRSVPILGVYYGKFGFVTQCTGDEVQAALTAHLAGECAVEDRMMLKMELRRGGGTVAEIHVLNEIVLQRSTMDRMLTFQISVDGRKMTRYSADGVIVCTPTGSTAYNLSAGGPLLEPTMQAMTLTALAPHTLTARPLVLHPESVVELQVLSEGDSVCSADGLTRLHLLNGDAVRVSRSERVTRLIIVDEGDFVTKLGKRLFFSQSMYGEKL